MRLKNDALYWVMEMETEYSNYSITVLGGPSHKSKLCVIFDAVRPFIFPYCCKIHFFNFAARRGK